MKIQHIKYKIKELLFCWGHAICCLIDSFLCGHMRASIGWCGPHGIYPVKRVPCMVARVLMLGGC